MTKKSNKGQKTLTTTTNKTAVTDIKVRTYETALDAFFTQAALSSADERAIRGDVATIRDAQQKMVECGLIIGEKLQHIRATMGADKFGTFATNVIPRMGLSRSACYRWLGGAEKVTSLINNPTARKALYLLTDGRGVTVIDDKGKIDVTPEFTKALKQVPAPSGTLDDKGAEEWALKFQKVLGQSGATEKKTPAQREKEARERLVAACVGLYDKYGKPAYERAMKDAINAVEAKEKTIKATEIKPQAAAATK